MTLAADTYLDSGRPEAEVEDLLRRAPVFQPLHTVSALKALAKSTGGDPRWLVLQIASQPAAVMLFQEREYGGLRVAYSRGRYGFLGTVFLIQPTQALVEVVVQHLQNYAKSQDLDCITLSFDPIAAKEINPQWLGSVDVCDQVDIFLCDLDDVFEGEDDFNFQGYERFNSNLRRNLKKGLTNGYQVEQTFEWNDLELWHEQCHLPRMRELDGRVWSLDFLNNLTEGIDWSLYMVKDGNGDVAGGCLAFLTKDVTEIFMMSTPNHHLQKGAHFVLTDHIYRETRKRGAKYVNWQSSNPPDGGIANFKLQWKARMVPVWTVTILRNKEKMRRFSPAELMDGFDECFVIPFAWFKEAG